MHKTLNNKYWLFFFSLVLVLLVLVIWSKWSIVYGIGFSSRSRVNGLSQFLRGSLRDRDNFKYNYPDECRMPKDLPYPSTEYYQTFFDIWDNLHNRPTYLRFHRWCKKWVSDLMVSSYRNDRAYIYHPVEEENMVDNQSNLLPPWLRLTTITVITIAPALFEYLFF